VRSGLIYRSDAGARGSLADASVALGLATILDLRTGDECVVDGAHQGREVTTARRLHVPLFEEISANWSEPTDLRADAIADRYLEMLSAGAHRFAVLLRLLASADSLPAVIHCVSGRDRTGIVVACLLSIIGVSDDLVADDYALSPPIRLNPKQAMAFGAETSLLELPRYARIVFANRESTAQNERRLFVFLSAVGLRPENGRRTHTEDCQAGDSGSVAGGSFWSRSRWSSRMSARRLR
jgi:hypothetical protein